MKEFSIKKWREFYDQISAIGSVVRKNNRAFHNDMVCELTREQMDAMTEEASYICKEAASYMDSCGVRCPAPLWKYSLKDEKTHLSSPEFAYSHLVREVVV